MERPHPAESPIAPAHGFGPGQLHNRFGQNFGQHFGRRAALAMDHGDIEFALGIGALLALLERDAGRFQEALDGFFGRVDAGAFLFFGDVGLFRGQAVESRASGAAVRRSCARPRTAARGPTARRRPGVPNPSPPAPACARGFLRRKRVEKIRHEPPRLTRGSVEDQGREAPSPSGRVKDTLREVKGTRALTALSRAPRGVGALAGCEPGFAAGFGEGSHASDIGGAFGHRNHAARIEQIEIVARLQALVIGGQREARREQAFAFLLRVGEMAEQNLGVGMLEIVFRVFDFRLMKHFAVAESAR